MYEPDLSGSVPVKVDLQRQYVNLGLPLSPFRLPLTTHPHPVTVHFKDIVVPSYSYIRCIRELTYKLFFSNLWKLPGSCPLTLSLVLGRGRGRLEFQTISRTIQVSGSTGCYSSRYDPLHVVNLQLPS